MRFLGGNGFALALSILLLAFVVAAPEALAICRPFPKDGERIFSIVRHDQIVGEARYVFRRTEERLFVRIDVSYALGSAAAPLYKLEHHSEESWENGRLKAMISDTEENGQRWRLRLDWNGEQLDGKSNQVALAISGLPVPSSMWHRDTPKSEALVSSIDGFVRPLSVHPLGRRTMMAAGREIEADGYILIGALERTLWYDSECQLVAASHNAQDGREIFWELRSNTW